MNWRNFSPDLSILSTRNGMIENLWLFVYTKSHSEIVRDERSFADAVFCLGSEVNVRSSDSPRTLIMLSIRGTYEAGDILQDLKFEQASFDGRFGAKVHRGFMQQFEGIKQSAISFIDNALKKDRNIDEILITGHSLGGAIAAMLGVLVSEKYQERTTRVVTFGSPAPGNIEFQRLFNSRKYFLS